MQSKAYLRVNCDRRDDRKEELSNGAYYYGTYCIRVSFTRVRVTGPDRLVVTALPLMMTTQDRQLSFLTQTLPLGSVGYEERGQREGRAARLARQGGCGPARGDAWAGRELQRRDRAAGVGRGQTGGVSTKP